MSCLANILDHAVLSKASVSKFIWISGKWIRNCRLIKIMIETSLDLLYVNYECRTGYDCSSNFILPCEMLFKKPR